MVDQKRVILEIQKQKPEDIKAELTTELRKQNQQHHQAEKLEENQNTIRHSSGIGKHE